MILMTVVVVVKGSSLKSAGPCRPLHILHYQCGLVYIFGHTYLTATTRDPPASRLAPPASYYSYFIAYFM